ncbi:MAG: SlyX family protein [Pseudomonadota bacterium]
MSEKRFEDLEVRLAYQDQMLSELNDVVTRQQAMISALERRHERLLERFRAVLEEGPGADEGFEKPPHY